MEQRKRNAGARIFGYHDAVDPRSKFSRMRSVFGKHVIECAHALGVGHEFRPITQQAAGGNLEHEPAHAAARVHADHQAFSAAEFFDDRTHVFFVNVNGEFFVGSMSTPLISFKITCGLVTCSS